MFNNHTESANKATQPPKRPKRKLPRTPDEIARDDEGLEPISDEESAEVAYITQKIEAAAAGDTHPKAAKEARQKRLSKKEVEEISASQVRDNKVVWKADEYEPAVTVGDIKETLRQIHEIMRTTSSIDITPATNNEGVIDITGNRIFHDEYLDIGI